MSNDNIFESLFKAKLRDTGLDYSEDDFERFCNQIGPAFKNGILQLNGQRIGINVLTKLTKVLRTSPHVRVFNLYGNLIRDHGIHSLQQLLLSNPQVEILDIGCNDLSNQAVPSITEIILSSQITSLQLGANDVAWHNNKFSLQSLIDIIDAVHKSRRIQCLGLSGLQMSTRTGAKVQSISEQLAQFIHDDEIIRSLSIADNGFYAKDLEVVIKYGLLSNDRLLILDMHSSNLSEPVGTFFLNSIYQMSSLSKLDIHSCQLSPSAGQALAESLKLKNQIAFLNVSDNNLGNEGARAIFEVLLENDTLTEIDISGNGFDTEITTSIADVLMVNKVLHTLDISRNAIGDEGAIVLADAFQQNETLVKFSLCSCRIGDEGAISLAYSLSENKSLRSLKMTDNFLTRESGYQILEAIKPNETLFMIDVSATQIDHFVMKAINDLCKRNKQIEREIALQPLKKDLVRLSIQRTKMPEAVSRLADLESTHNTLDDNIRRTEDDLDTTQITCNLNLQSLEKQRINTLEMITEENEAIKKVQLTRENMEDEFEKKMKEVEVMIENEKRQTEHTDEDTNAIEQQISEIEEKKEQRKCELRLQIEQILAMVKEQQNIGKDHELLAQYEPPQLPDFAVDPNDPIFLIDHVDEMRNEELARGKKKKKKGRSTSPKSSRKTKKPTNEEPQSDLKESADITKSTSRTTIPKKPKISIPSAKKSKTPSSARKASIRPKTTIK